ncbi:hypothetical protein ACIBF6_07575 [Streptosporangium amethystogenes]|uniref:hypothetical protein n=1 Tax=Streptosporangium amethystogenes TaxID=2002 RepID=UPI0037929248
MNTTPGSDAPTNRRGGSPISQAIAAAPPATEQSAAVRRAENLAAVLADVHNIVADVHELTSGNAIVSLRRGLIAYTDGERFWWTSPERDDAGAPILSGELDLDQAAEQLAAHHALMAKRDATDPLLNRMPLLADVIMAEHVDPR